MAKQEPVQGPLSEDEVKAALENEGYPFELRVFRLLDDLDWNPYFGERLSVGDEEGPVRETDVIASRHVYIKRGEDEVGGLDLNLVIEAKKIHEGAFVGFLNDDEFMPAALRCGPIGGLPSYGVLQAPHDTEYELFYDANKLGPAFAQLTNDEPYCIQWALPRRLTPPKNGRLFAADHQAPVAQDLSGVVETAAKIAHNVTFAALRRRAGPEVELAVSIPILVLDAPLYTYDVDTKDLVRVHRMLLRVGTNTVLARDDWALVDVVDIVGLEELVESVETALAVARDVLNEPAYQTTLTASAKVQSEKWNEAEIHRALSGRQLRFRTAGDL